MNKNSIIAILVIAITIGLGVLIAFTGNPKEAVRSSSTENNSGIVREDAYFKGAKGAKVEIVEFSDFQCEYCKMAAPEIKKAADFYGDKVVFYYRHFPLPQHKLSKDAAIAAEAAGLQGKFWEMEELIFEKQAELKEESFEIFAAGLGLDLTKFKSDIKSSELVSKIESDLADAQKLGVNSTPTFFINGEKLEGFRTFEEWKGEIESKLGDN